MARMGERPVRAAVGAAMTAAALSAVTLVAPTPATAGGGDPMFPDRDRYEPGQQVTLVGYTQPVATRLADNEPENQPGWRALGPWYAYLRVDPDAVERDGRRDPGQWSLVHPTDLRLGQVLAEETPTAGVPGSLRVGVSFRLPDELDPDVYAVAVCNDPCTMTLGWLFDFTSVPVGVDPERPIVRLWPLDEPVIRYLDDAALVAAPVCEADCNDVGDWSVTAAEIRGGYRPPPATVRAEPAPAAGTSTTGPPASRPVANAGTSPAGRAGADPAGGIPGEVVAWLLAFGAFVVVWCLAWRWRPSEARMVVRQGGGRHDHGRHDHGRHDHGRHDHGRHDYRASDDDADPVQIKL